MFRFLFALCDLGVRNGGTIHTRGRGAPARIWGMQPQPAAKQRINYIHGQATVPGTRQGGPGPEPLTSLVVHSLCTILPLGILASHH